MDATQVSDSVDPRRALSILGYERTSSPERVTGGWDTLLWRFRTADGMDHALRVFHRQRLRSIAWRERVALEACANAGLPSPRVEAAADIDGLPAMVLSWCPGQPLLRVIENRPWTVWKLGSLFGKTQAKIHAVSPPSEFVADAPDEWIARVPGRDADLADHVRSLAPATSSLVHMDYHPLNVIYDGSRITGVIDWAGGAAGDPRADLARTAITLMAAPIPPSPLRPVLKLARQLIIRAWRSGYEQEAGGMPDYRQFLAWAAATLIAEIELVIGSPDVWGTEEDVETLRKLVDAWAREAGVR